MRAIFGKCRSSSEASVRQLDARDAVIGLAAALHQHRWSFAIVVTVRLDFSTCCRAQAFDLSYAPEEMLNTADASPCKIRRSKTWSSQIFTLYNT